MTLKGITTDASSLYPRPVSQVFGDVPHQICEFHVLKELTKAVLRAVAKVRKELVADLLFASVRTTAWPARSYSVVVVRLPVSVQETSRPSGS